MDVLYSIFVVLHLLGWAIVLGGALANMRQPKLAPGVLHGALTALITGILLVGLAEATSGGPEEINHMKIGIKLLVALVVTGLAIYGRRNTDVVSRGYLGGIAGLVVVNVALAVIW
ncbi:MAG TPA: hypothetical protein VK063_13175 [Beutenbergiaceae bacterium]|nr:hypothetical protein [Beutenbergiaceae bacterium]